MSGSAGMPLGPSKREILAGGGDFPLTETKGSSNKKAVGFAPPQATRVPIWLCVFVACLGR